LGSTDQVEGGEHESEQKTGTGSSFATILAKNLKNENLGFSRSKISIAMGRGRSIFWAIVYFMDLNICAKFQGHSSTASYLSRGSQMKMPSEKYASGAILGYVYLDE